MPFPVVECQSRATCLSGNGDTQLARVRNRQGLGAPRSGVGKEGAGRTAALEPKPQDEALFRKRGDPINDGVGCAFRIRTAKIECVGRRDHVGKLSHFLPFGVAMSGEIVVPGNQQPSSGLTSLRRTHHE